MTHLRARSIVSKLLPISVLLLGFLSAGCKCGREEQKPVEKPEQIDAEPALPPDVDAGLLSDLKEAALLCKAAEGKTRIDCQGGEKSALVLSFNRGQRKRIASLPTFAFALKDPDEKLKALAAAVLYASFRTDLGPEAKPEAVSKELSKQLLEAALALPDSMSMQAIPAATHAALLSDQKQLLFDALDQGVAVQVKTMAYRYMMVYGRLSVFERISAAAKDPGAAVVLAAVESPRNMQNWTQEEQAAICPWARTLLEDARPPVAGNAAAVLSNCAGGELDALLDRVTKVQKENQFSYLHATALRDICGDVRKGRPVPASDAQCERVRKLQTEAARDSDLEGRVRAMALSTMAHTWPDAQTLEVAKKLAKEKNVEVARSAAQIVTRLSKQLEAATGKSAAGQKSPTTSTGAAPASRGTTMSGAPAPSSAAPGSTGPAPASP